ncbi:threonine/serine exporter family protein [Bacillus sp. FJAT-49736]|uniref:threonine/serine exporter family protein n=1 Tax=Bacillus sp. FJAT-49736 TaxID=2833582 RepID=UPI001BC9E24E|nr:threonine/serine exporter family protein [Bacillus sp. FJAT-49736]MBS4175330.1 threonine/serine exporter family protein [Bacillus sp. FJAT-49736]
MVLLGQLITSFIATAGFGVLFNVPRSKLLLCGLVGMLGWIVYFAFSSNFHTDSVIASFIAAFLVGIISQTFARIYKEPIIIFSVSGIIPLVPGGLAYDAMRHFVENDYNSAIQLAAKAFMLSGAIAIGIVFSEVVKQLIRKPKSS